MKFSKIVFTGLLTIGFMSRSTIGDLVDDVVAVPVSAAQKTGAWIEDRVAPTEKTTIVINNNTHASIKQYASMIKNLLSTPKSQDTLQVVNDTFQTLISDLDMSGTLRKVSKNLQKMYAASVKNHIRTLKSAVTKLTSFAHGQNEEIRSTVLKAFADVHTTLLTKNT